MNTATKITFIRIFFVPIFLVLILINSLESILFALIIFILGGLSDTIDGVLARKSGTVTKIGATLDPLADKLLITTALICLLKFKELNVPIWTVIIIILRDYVITWVRTLDHDKVMPADKTAKIKTFLQNAVIIYIFTVIILKKQITAIHLEKILIDILPRISMIFVSLFTLLSGLIYIIKYRDLILESFK